MILQKEKTKKTRMKLIMKFAWDRALMPRIKKRQQEIGTFNIILEEHTLATTKSSTNMHQYIIFLEEEKH